MSSSKVEELNKDVDDLVNLLTIAKRTKVKDLLSLQIRKLEAEIIKLNELNVLSNVEASNKVINPTVKCYDVKITNYAWDQNNDHVKLFVTLNNVHNHGAQLITCEFTERSVELRVNGFENKNYILKVSNLFCNISMSGSFFKIKTNMVIVYLKKAKVNNNWKYLTANENQQKVTGKKELDEEDPIGDPSQGLMNLMKKMYDDGDDEMKRTIAKAWCEGRDKGGNTVDL